MPQLDLVIRGGEVVGADGSRRADVGIADGVVAQVHLSSPPGDAGPGPRWVDDFTSGSRAALAGGVTTVGNMTFLGDGELPLAGLAREAAAVRAQAIVDV